jgi:translation initiation factor 2D
MFAKAASVCGTAKEHRLSGRDAKAVLDKAGAVLGMSDAELRDALGLRKDNMLVSKLPASGALLYWREASEARGAKRALLIDLDGRGEWWPTLEALWLVPTMLARLEVHAPVSRFVLNGSDVMLPGVVRLEDESRCCYGLGSDLAVGQKRALFVAGNPLPIAVGTMAVDKGMLLGAGFRGRAMVVVHRFGDHLWELNGKTIPNAGFLPDRVEATEAAPPPAPGACDAAAAAPAPTPAEAPAPAPAPVPAPALSPAAATSEAPPVSGSPDPSQSALTHSSPAAVEDSSSDAAAGASVAQALGAVSLGATASAAPADASGVHAGFFASWSAQELCDRTLLQALKRHAPKERELPMLISTFVATTLLPSRPAGAQLELKQTPYKKASQLLAAAAERGLLTLGGRAGGRLAGDKATQAETVVAVDRAHAELRAFEPWDLALEHRAAAAAAEGGDGADGADNAAELCVIELWRAQSPQQRQVLGGEENAWMTAREAKAALSAFAAAHGLEAGDRRSLRLRSESAPEAAALLAAVLLGAKAASVPAAVGRAEAAELFLGRLQRGYRVDAPGAPAGSGRVKVGAPPKVSVLTERRQGGKWVTRAWGLEAFGCEDVPALARAAQHALACSVAAVPREEGSAGLAPGKVLMELVAQGRVPHKVVELLAQAVHLSAGKHFDVQDGPKPRK